MRAVDATSEEQGGRVPQPGRRLRVLLLIKCLGYGGAERLLVDMVRHGDRSRFDYEVAYMLEAEDALVPVLRSTGTKVHALGAKSNTDLSWCWRLRSLLRQRQLRRCSLSSPAGCDLRPRGRVEPAGISAAGPGVHRAQHVGQDGAGPQGVEQGHHRTRRSVGGRLRIGPVRLAADTSEAGTGRDPRYRPGSGTPCPGGTRGHPERPARGTGAPRRKLLAVTVANLRPEKGIDTLLQSARQVIDASRASAIRSCGSWTAARRARSGNTPCLRSERISNCWDNAPMSCGSWPRQMSSFFHHAKKGSRSPSWRRHRWECRSSSRRSESCPGF